MPESFLIFFILLTKTIMHSYFFLVSSLNNTTYGNDWLVIEKWVN
jgi:hypothetical protein